MWFVLQTCSRLFSSDVLFHGFSTTSYWYDSKNVRSGEESDVHWRGMENRDVHLGMHLHFPKNPCCAPVTATKACHHLPSMHQHLSWSLQDWSSAQAVGNEGCSWVTPLPETTVLTQVSSLIQSCWDLLGSDRDSLEVRDKEEISCPGKRAAGL